LSPKYRLGTAKNAFPFRLVRDSALNSPRRTGIVTSAQSSSTSGVSTMGKYVLGWFLGVPVIVLVILYMLFH